MKTPQTIFAHGLAMALSSHVIPVHSAPYIAALGRDEIDELDGAIAIDDAEHDLTALGNATRASLTVASRVARRPQRAIGGAANAGNGRIWEVFRQEHGEPWQRPMFECHSLHDAVFLAQGLASRFDNVSDTIEVKG